MKTLRRILPLLTAAAIASPILAHEADNFKIVPSDGAIGDAFGSAVAIDGTVALVASPLADGIGADSGAVYVFTFDGVAWNEMAKLTASNAAAGDLFGSALAIDGNRMLVGAPGANAGGGAAYAFSFDGVSWSEDTILAPAGLAAGAGYGTSLDISGTTAVVGAPNASAAYVFVDGGLGWAQEASLSAAAGTVGDEFGAGVTVNNDLVAVGTPHGFGNVANTGLVNLFFRTGTSWAEGQKLFLSFGQDGDLYGAALDMYAGSELLVGVPGLNNNGLNAGGSQRWSRESGIWRIAQSYPGRDAGDRMGTSISLYERTNVMGVAGDDDEALDAGTTYRFLKGSITPLEVYVGHDIEAADAFGTAVSVSNIWAANGAPGHNLGTGAAYIHANVQATVRPLLGSGLNPAILATTAGPVIGQPWNLDIDLTLFPESERTAIVIKKNRLVTPILSIFGEVFFKLTDPTIIRNVALGNHVLNIPNNISLLDNEVTLMGIVYGAAIDGFPILALTNGETIIIGTTDLPVNVEI